MTNAADSEKTFRALFCQRHRCSEEKFVDRLLWKSLYRRAFPLATLLQAFNKNFFARDRKFLARLGDTITEADFNAELDTFYHKIRHSGNYLQQTLRLRASGKRLKQIRRDLYGLD